MRPAASRATPGLAATAVVILAVTNVDYIIVLSVLCARSGLPDHSLSHRGTRSSL